MKTGKRVTGALLILFLFMFEVVLSEDAGGATEVTAESLRKAGDAAMNYKRFEEATNKFSQAVELEPDNYVNYLKRATAYQLRGKPLSAIKDYTRILELKPTHWKVFPLSSS